MIFKFTFEIDTDTAPDVLYKAVKDALRIIEVPEIDRTFYDQTQNLRWQIVYTGKGV